MMSFELKNAKAMFQIMINKAFVKQISHNIEAYVDDIMVKSEKVEEYVKDLEELFNILRKFGVNLNLEKYIIGVTTRKFLGFIVQQSGIETNPEKIKAIIDMQPLSIVEAVQKFTSRILALNSFMSRSTDRCLPFFTLLRKIGNFEWIEEYQYTFDGLKGIYILHKSQLNQSQEMNYKYTQLCPTQ